MPRPEHPFDRQLRAVPERAGLARRLRAAAVDDEALDHWLRDVAVPPRLAAGLQDAVLDAALCEPPGERPAAELSRRILSAVLDDAALDEALRGAPDDMPLSLSAEALVDEAIDVALRDTPPAPVSATAAPAAPRRRTAGSRRGRPRPWRGAVAAACLMLLLLGLQWAALYRIAASMLPRPDGGLLVADGGPLDLSGSLGEDLPLERAVQFVSSTASGEPRAKVELQQLEPPLRGGAYHTLAAAIDDGLDLGEDLIAARIEQVGYPARTEPPPPQVELVSHPAAAPSPPLDRAYDRAFHWRYGVSPWIPAAALPGQEMSLTADPRAFDRALWQLLQDRTVRPQQVRVEDALATVDPGFRMPADGALGIRTLAGPSYFGGPGAGLLLAGVAAGAPAGRLATPVRLTVLLDASDAMAPLDQWAAHRELLAAARALRGDDRLTIVALGGPSRVVCENAGPEQLQEVARALAALRPRGFADWGRGLPRALLAAVEGAEPGQRQELVVVSSGRGDWSGAAEPYMDEALANARRQGVAVGVAVCRDLPQPRLRRWAEARELPWAEGPDAAGRSLVRAICGREATVARDVRLHLKFNPQAVAAYRVIGSDGLPSQWDADPAPLEMRAGQQACVLVEVRWQGGSQDDAGWAELTWKDMQGRPQRRRQRISRLQFAPSFSQSAVGLQAAALVAEAAQVLAESPFAKGRAHTLQRVAERAEETPDEVRLRPEIVRLRRAAGPAEAALRAAEPR